MGVVLLRYILQIHVAVLRSPSRQARLGLHLRRRYCLGLLLTDAALVRHPAPQPILPGQLLPARLLACRGLGEDIVPEHVEINDLQKLLICHLPLGQIEISRLEDIAETPLRHLLFPLHQTNRPLRESADPVEPPKLCHAAVLAV